jgi:50S ribosomal protein L16 3-hydroxylase
MISTDLSREHYPLSLKTLGTTISTADFIKNYWQQKPLLIRQALPCYSSPLSPEEFIGLALEEELESRLILEHGETPWQLKCGPFTEKDYAQLPNKGWTLLIQSLNHWISDLDDLLEFFRFIPNWRLDDVMGSFAVDGGSVGPHFDQYDVFLLQANGNRRWKIGQKCDQDSPCIKDIDLHILQQFEQTDEWLLEPGDMLYLPPGIAHWGVAEGDNCMTYSIGFRAPSHGDLLADFIEEQLSQTSSEQRYTDPGFKQQLNPGEISAEALAQITNILQSYIEKPSQIADWFGRYSTRSKSEEAPELTCVSEHDNIFAGSIHVEDGFYKRNPFLRFAYIPVKDFSHHEQNAHLYIGGEQYLVSLAFADLICASNVIHSDDLTVFFTDTKDKNALNMMLAQDVIFSETSEEPIFGD